MRVEPFGIAHQILRPLRREQIELHHKIEKLVGLPLGIVESLVARRWRDRRLRLFAGKPAHRRTPEIEIGLADLHLQFGRPIFVRQPVFRHRAESLDHLGELAGRLVGDFAALARLEIGCERLAAALHGPREVHREGFGVELLRNLGFGRNVAHIRNL